MAKKDIVKVEPRLDVVPAFMAADVGVGTEDMQEYVSVPRLKIVQKQSSEELQNEFPVGTVLMSPVNVIAAPMPDNKGEEPVPLEVIPLYFYPEWVTWNHISTRGVLNSIRYRTTSPNDPIVEKSRNPGLREEPAPDDRSNVLRHVEHLNFVCKIVGDSPIAGETVVVSFSRGSHADGRKFSTLIRMRRAPIYGCRFLLARAKRKNQKGDWWVLVPQNPEESPWADEADYPALKQQHEDLKVLHESAKLRVNLDEDEAPETENTEL